MTIFYAIYGVLAIVLTLFAAVLGGLILEFRASLTRDREAMIMLRSETDRHVRLLRDTAERHDRLIQSLMRKPERVEEQV